MTDYQKLSEDELQIIKENVEKALKAKQANKRKEVMTQIRELAASIDATVDIHEAEKKSMRKGIKVPAKYRHPEDATKSWAGRGIKPKWLRALLDAGHDLSEFKI
ncbi:MAG: histone [Gammaproteobacteria bacterium HGW-Gammaproteobacteria-3]|nr:MAG: histone [Gammaproteobacteria bacterium HGW-Gammaproteobacteria-3]